MDEQPTHEQGDLMRHCLGRTLETLRERYPEAGDHLFVTLIVRAFADVLHKQTDQAALIDLVNGALGDTAFRLVRRTH